MKETGQPFGDLSKKGAQLRLGRNGYAAGHPLLLNFSKSATSEVDLWFACAEKTAIATRKLLLVPLRATPLRSPPRSPPDDRNNTPWQHVPRRGADTDAAG